MRCGTVLLVHGSEVADATGIAQVAPPEETAAGGRCLGLLVSPAPGPRPLQQPCLGSSLAAVAGRTRGPAAQVTIALDEQKEKQKAPLVQGVSISSWGRRAVKEREQKHGPRAGSLGSGLCSRPTCCVPSGGQRPLWASTAPGGGRTAGCYGQPGPEGLQITLHSPSRDGNPQRVGGSAFLAPTQLLG